MFRIWNALSIDSYFKCFCSSPGKEQDRRLEPGCMRILRNDGLLNKPRICFLVHCAGRRLLLLPRTGLPCHAFSTAVRLKSLKTMSRDELLLHQIVSVGNLGPQQLRDNNVFWKFIIKWTGKSPQISVRLLVLPEHDVNYTKDPKCLVFKSFLPAKY